eukprot:COSAG01_NODE_8603_length_2722_cov_1.458635_2_plen_64_part_00
MRALCVRRRRWRILVGEDARRLDAAVRAAPEAAYDAEGLVDPARRRAAHAEGGGRRRRNVVAG